MREIGLFFQNQILGMHWLKELIQNLLELTGISGTIDRRRNVEFLFL